MGVIRYNEVYLKVGTKTIRKFVIGEKTALEGETLTIGRDEAIEFLRSHEGEVEAADITSLASKLSFGL